MRQQHIRQHRTAPAAIEPAVPFASQADTGRAESVMRPIMAEPHPIRQFSDPSAALQRPRVAIVDAVSPLQFTREDAASRYTLHDDGDLVCVLDYRDDGASVSMTRTFTVPPFRGRGYAARLVEHAVADLERRGDRTVVPMCWFVEEWFQQHPDRAGILAERTPAPPADASGSSV